MWARHPVLLGWWLTLLGVFGLGFVFKVDALFVLPVVAAMIASVITYRCVGDGVLARRALYYVLVGLLLASSVVTVVAAGSTLFIKADHTVPIVGFTALGAMNLVIAIITWRALVRPEAKRAARAGMLAVVTEMFAMILDIVINFRVREFNSNEMWIGITLFGALITMATGALACIAALSAFDPPDEHDIPAARIVDETP